MFFHERIVEVPHVSCKHGTDLALDGFLDVARKKNVVQCTIVPAADVASEGVDALHHVLRIIPMPVNGTISTKVACNKLRCCMTAFHCKGDARRKNRVEEFRCIACQDK